MPSIPLHPPSKLSTSPSNNILPQVLQTPSGLAILEIQGTVNSTLTESGPSGSLPLGKLTFPLCDPSAPDDKAWQKRVYLFVGKNQRLTGEAKKLTKPIAVLRKREGTQAEEMEVADIVYWKVLFASRPEPVGADASGAQ